MTTRTTNEVLGDEVRAWMARRRKTQADVGAVLRVTQSQVGKRLRGEIAWPVAEIVAVARFLGADPLDLLGPAVAADVEVGPLAEDGAA